MECQGDQTTTFVPRGAERGHSVLRSSRAPSLYYAQRLGDTDIKEGRVPGVCSDISCTLPNTLRGLRLFSRRGFLWAEMISKPESFLIQCGILHSSGRNDGVPWFYSKLVSPSRGQTGRQRKSHADGGILPEVGGPFGRGIEIVLYASFVIKAPRGIGSQFAGSFHTPNSPSVLLSDPPIFLSSNL